MSFSFVALLSLVDIQLFNIDFHRDRKQKRKLVFLDHYVCRNISYHFVLHLHSRGLGIEHCDWLLFRFYFRLQESSFHWIVSDGFTSGIGILLPTPLVFIWSYHSALSLITSLTMTPSPVKTSLKNKDIKEVVMLRHILLIVTYFKQWLIYYLRVLRLIVAFVS